MNQEGADIAAHDRARSGLAYGIAAYLSWGVIVFYFKAVDHVPALEVLAHRILWSIVILGTLLAWRGRWREGVRAVADRRTALTLLVTTALIAVNWFVFIWAVMNDQVMQASLGYYINPLVNVLLGVVLLGERLRRVQTLAVTIAGVAVLLLTLRLGELPLVSLALAGSFGLYGLLRKTMRVDSLVGLAVETTLLLPIAFGYLWLLEVDGRGSFVGGSPGTQLLLVAAGAVTALPLLWFTHAARRLEYSTVGILHYLAPTLHFLSAVLVFGEPLTAVQLLSFAMIWIALGLYSWDSLRSARQRRAGAVPV